MRCRAGAAAETGIVNGWQMQSGAGNSGSLGAEPRDDLISAQLPLVQWLELGEHPSCAAAAAAAGEGCNRVDRGILQNDVGELTHLLRHGGEGEIPIAQNRSSLAVRVLP